MPDMDSSSDAVSYRRATAADTRACHDLLWTSATDLGRRHGTSGGQLGRLVGTASRRSRTASHAVEWWIAEIAEGDQPIGYAGSIERGGLFELTESFVRPGRQSKGVGRGLIERAFPVGRGDVRSIIATTDVRANARYYAADTVARFPYYTLNGSPRADPAGRPRCRRRRTDAVALERSGRSAPSSSFRAAPMSSAGWPKPAPDISSPAGVSRSVTPS